MTGFEVDGVLSIYLSLVEAFSSAIPNTPPPSISPASCLCLTRVRIWVGVGVRVRVIVLPLRQSRIELF